MRRVAHPHLGEQGQSLAEFAIIVPLLMILLLGLIDVGMLLAANNTVSSASRQGARMMEAFGANVSDVDQSTILPAVRDALKSGGSNVQGLIDVTFYQAPDAATAQQGYNPNPAKEAVYTYNPGSDTFVLFSGTYTSTSRASYDFVGVTVRYRYTGITPLFSGGFTISNVSNTQIDPVGGTFDLPTPAPAPTPPPAPTATAYPTSTPAPTLTPYPTATPYP